jgi:hypothetical protein
MSKATPRALHKDRHQKQQAMEALVEQAEREGRDLGETLHGVETVPHQALRAARASGRGLQTELDSQVHGSVAGVSVNRRC